MKKNKSVYNKLAKTKLKVVKVIRLREAREKAKELTNYSVPSMSTLGDWRGWGCLTETLEYDNRGRPGGRVGLYDDSLPLQIATAAELKDTKAWGLKKIGKIAKKIIPLIIENKDPQVDKVFFSTFLEIDKEMDQAKEASKKAKETNDPEKLEKAEEELEKAFEKIQRRHLIQDYHSLWNKYETRYEKEKIKQ